MTLSADLCSLLSLIALMTPHKGNRSAYTILAVLLALFSHSFTANMIPGAMIELIERVRHPAQ